MNCDLKRVKTPDFLAFLFIKMGRRGIRQRSKVAWDLEKKGVFTVRANPAIRYLEGNNSPIMEIP